MGSPRSGGQSFQLSLLESLHYGLDERSVKKALLFLDFKGKTIVLNGEQEKALYNLLEGNDVLAVLPTVFGKSMIFTMLSVAAREQIPEAVSVLVSIAAQQHNHRLNRIVMCYILKSRGLFPPLMPCLLQNLFHFRLYAPFSDDSIIKFTLSQSNYQL